MTIEIKHKFTGEVLQTVDAESLRGANLRGVNLGFADLRGADLRNADLRDADLYGANLRCADLSGADLRGANPGCADLCRADLRGACLGGIIYDTKPERERRVQELLDAIDKHGACGAIQEKREVLR
jgi:hypothetical protein